MPGVYQTLTVVPLEIIACYWISLLTLFIYLFVRHAHKNKNKQITSTDDIQKVHLNVI